LMRACWNADTDEIKRIFKDSVIKPNVKYDVRKYKSFFSLIVNVQN